MQNHQQIQNRDERSEGAAAYFVGAIYCVHHIIPPAHPNTVSKLPRYKPQYKHIASVSCTHSLTSSGVPLSEPLSNNRAERDGRRSNRWHQLDGLIAINPMTSVVHTSSTDLHHRTSHDAAESSASPVCASRCLSASVNFGLSVANFSHTHTLTMWRAAPVSHTNHVAWILRLPPMPCVHPYLRLRSTWGKCLKSCETMSNTNTNVTLVATHMPVPHPRFTLAQNHLQNILSKPIFIAQCADSLVSAADCELCRKCFRMHNSPGATQQQAEHKHMGGEAQCSSTASNPYSL